MAAHPERICPHLHISMQSGSDSVLSRMRRRWGSRRFVDRCRLVQQSLHEPALTTDVIVGFPGETDEEFQATLDVCREVGFSKIHIFPFSARRGTPAAEMPRQVPKPEQRARCQRLAALETELRDAYFRRLLGVRLRVLVEESVQGGAIGTSCRYAPVQIAASQTLPGAFADASPHAVRDGVIEATAG
jgi:threonylcarbamoyladenosine tRNA methylthiotransferase MtaB